jgi:hypothetical protein
MFHNPLPFIRPISSYHYGVCYRSGQLVSYFLRLGCESDLNIGDVTSLSLNTQYGGTRVLLRAIHF